jgi:hypothetical protein
MVTKICLALIFDSLIILVLLCSFILTIISHLNISKLNLYQVSRLNKNWKYGPILDFSECDSNLFDDQWPATQSACICNYLSTNNETIFTVNNIGGICGTMWNSTCKDFPSKNAINYFSWKNHNFCGKRMNLTYPELNITDSSCPFDLKKCGVIDDLGNILCVPKQDTCPLNYLKIINDLTELPENFMGNTITLQNSFLLYSNQYTNNSIISQFYISEKQPCIDPSHVNTIYPEYELSISSGKENCPIITNNLSEDNTFQLIDKYSKYNLYLDNNIIPYINNFTNYPHDSLNIDIGLYMRNYIGLESSCHKRLQSALVPADINDISSYVDIVKGIRLSSNVLLCMISIGFTFGIMYLLALISFGYFSRSKCLGFYESRMPRILILFIIFITFIIYLIVLLSMLNGLIQLARVYEYLAEENCADDVTNYLVGVVYNDLFNIKSKTYILIVLMLVGIFTYSGYLILRSRVNHKTTIIEMTDLE